MPTKFLPRSLRRFSLTSLLILVTAACIWFACVKAHVQHQRHVVQELSRLRANIVYGHTRSNEPPAGPPWLRQLIGPEYFDHVVEVHFRTIPPDDSHLKLVGSLVGLEKLSISSREITDDGLQHLAALVQLRSLDLRDTKITGRGVAHLKDLTDLQVLSLPINSLPEGLQHLSGLRQLHDLSLVSGWIGDNDLRHIIALSELRTLRLANTKITDAGIDALLQLKKLTYLDIANTAITDAGFLKLAELPSLTNIDFSGTDVSLAGRYEMSLRKPMMPGCAGVYNNLALRMPVRPLPFIASDAPAPNWLHVDSSLLRGKPSPHSIQYSFKNLADLIQAAHLAHPQLHNNTKGLSLMDCPTATDEDLAGLAQAWPDLERIVICSPAITDAGIQHLAKMKSLSYIAINDAAIGDAAVDVFLSLPGLKQLHLEKTQITSRGIQQLAELKSLESLGLSYSAVQDADLQSIAALPSLETLSLYATPVTISGLESLRSCTSLKHLLIDRNEFPFVQLAELEKSLPECKIGF